MRVRLRNPARREVSIGFVVLTMVSFIRVPPRSKIELEFMPNDVFFLSVWPRLESKRLFDDARGEAEGDRNGRDLRILHPTALTILCHLPSRLRAPKVNGKMA